MGEPWAQGTFTESPCGFPGEQTMGGGSLSELAQRLHLCPWLREEQADQSKTFYLASGFFHDLFRDFHLIIK